MTVRIHPTALVDPKAEIHPSCEIGPYCIIGPHVKMGPKNRLMSHVVIDNHTTIGEGNVFYPFAMIGAAPADLKYKGEETRLEIGNHNTIRESTSLHIGTAGGGGITRVGNHNLLMAYAHLGHDCQVGSYIVIANACQLAGHVIVEDWAIIGGVCGVSQFVRVGEHSYVGGCSGVDRDVAPYFLGKGPTGHFEIKGINLVGLKRRNVESEIISALMDTQKIFSDSNLEKSKALQQIQSKYAHLNEVKHFLEFVNKSEVGVYR